MELKEAYRMVYEDLIKNGPNFFRGIYDASHGTESFNFICGTTTVMEFIAVNVSEKTYEQYTEMVTKNMVASRRKANLRKE